MPCECCGTTATVAEEPQAVDSGCGCATDSGCDCDAGAPAPSARELKLERLVMDLDKRLRRLESAG